MEPSATLKLRTLELVSGTLFCIFAAVSIVTLIFIVLTRLAMLLYPLTYELLAIAIVFLALSIAVEYLAEKEEIAHNPELHDWRERVDHLPDFLQYLVRDHTYPLEEMEFRAGLYDRKRNHRARKL